MACCPAVRRPLLSVLLFAAACGDDAADPVDAAPPDARIDAPSNNCQSQGALGQFIRRAGNPRVLPGTTFRTASSTSTSPTPTFTSDQATQRWVAYWAAGHGTMYTGDPNMQAVIRRATSADRMTWTIMTRPGVRAEHGRGRLGSRQHRDADGGLQPRGSAVARYLMLYAGSDGTFPFAGAFPNHAIGAAFSADGVTFTRVPAASRRTARTGMVLTGKRAPIRPDRRIVADPELALVDGIYHLWFSSFACSGATCATTDTYGIAHATSARRRHMDVQEAPVRSLLRASATSTSGGAQPR